ncbi:LPXTG cell wall anchor domain-containing protein [Candidatus Woesearchaeota archaeon]|jgi:LPXTG-motif cell wall-anchored protein|nr:LPXTG cell wall anchor domain-containing protein [Candidatus Woesearchaeota archaeon]MBT7063022.1 LPXTG cell wall anchor domain-containing protein [Candidatus Woesearchaeota archaeon]MBT7402503.1 LPXTG cell wall anchor domain-containing protein [Candidatus Woesearchaeota archaeon]
MRKSILFLICLLMLAPVALAETEGISGVLVSSTTENVNAPENNGNIRLLQTKYDPYPAEPGQVVTLWVAAQNWGEESIENAYLRVVPEYPFRLPSGAGIEEVGRIAGFGERLVEYDLIVDDDAIEGVYSFNIQQCDDASCSNVIKEIEVSISVKTGGSPRIRVGLEDADTFQSSTNGDVTLNIVNRGRLDIKFLTLTLLPSDQYDILSPTEVYIGELESDDFDTVDYNLFINENVAEEDTVYVDLPVKVEYTDSNNKDYTAQSQVKLKVYSQTDLKRFGLMTENSGNNMYMIIGLIAAGGIFWYWRKRKNTNKQ